MCSVRGQDHRGLPLVVLVEAQTLFEATALGIEQLHKAGGRISEVEITVHEPGAQQKVRPDQLCKWLNQNDSESIGIHALKHRVRELLAQNGLT